MQRSVPIQPKTSENLPKICQKSATTLGVHYPRRPGGGGGVCGGREGAAHCEGLRLAGARGREIWEGNNRGALVLGCSEANLCNLTKCIYLLYLIVHRFSRCTVLAQLSPALKLLHRANLIHLPVATSRKTMLLTFIEILKRSGIEFYDFWQFLFDSCRSEF